MADLNAPVSWEEARALLLPVLRRSTEPPHAWRTARDDPDARLVSWPVLPHLRELLALDLPEVRAFVGRGQLAAWGVDEKTARQAAHDNLTPRASEGLEPRPAYGLWQLASGDGVEISRVLLSGWLAAFEGQVAGRPVAIVPASRVLLVGGSERAPEVDRLVTLANEVFRTAQQPVSPVPLTVDYGGRVVPLPLPDDHPSAGAVASAHRLLAAYEYAAQRDQLLQADVGLALPQVQLVRESASGRAWTQCRWDPTAGAALLPHTDRVVLAPASGGDFSVPWPALHDEAAGCLEPTDHLPARSRVRWPADKTLAALRDHALPEVS